MSDGGCFEDRAVGLQTGLGRTITAAGMMRLAGTATRHPDAPCARTAAFGVPIVHGASADEADISRRCRPAA
jgi:hypothetical protein